MEKTMDYYQTLMDAYHEYLKATEDGDWEACSGHERDMCKAAFEGMAAKAIDPVFATEMCLKPLQDRNPRW
jgi:hypothetical protein